MAEITFVSDEAVLQGERGEKGEQGEKGDKQEVKILGFAESDFTEEAVDSYSIILNPAEYEVENTFTILNVLKLIDDAYYSVIVDISKLDDGTISIRSNEPFDGEVNLLV